MYTLRKVIEGQEQLNFNLGNSYSLVEESKHKINFDNTFRLFFENSLGVTEDECFAFVICEKGKIEPIWRGQENYIMTESGKTFSVLR